MKLIYLCGIFLVLIAFPVLADHHIECYGRTANIDGTIYNCCEGLLKMPLPDRIPTDNDTCFSRSGYCDVECVKDFRYVDPETLNNSGVTGAEVGLVILILLGGLLAPLLFTVVIALGLVSFFTTLGSMTEIYGRKYGEKLSIFSPGDLMRLLSYGGALRPVFKNYFLGERFPRKVTNMARIWMFLFIILIVGFIIFAFSI